MVNNGIYPQAPGPAEAALPDHCDTPPQVFLRLDVSSITALISGNFAFPKASSAVWHLEQVAVVPVKEAASNVDQRTILL